MYKGFELIIGAIDRLVGGEVEVVILSKNCPSALLHPIVKDTKTKSLLLAMAKLAKKVSGKIKISSCKAMLKKYTTQSGGV